MNEATTYTYIIHTKSDELYCGKTNNVNKRFSEHKKERYPKWFGMRKDRKEFIEILLFKNDYEKEIKRAGVKFIYNLTKNKVVAS
jgi:predicted GIY-YIG superfamily endonuclease